MADPTDDLMKVLRVRVGLEPDDTTKDAQITTAYTAALEWMEEYLDRWLSGGAFVETFTHVSNRVVSLKAYPVEAITTITGDVDTATSYHVEKRNGLIHFDGYAVAHEMTVDYTAANALTGGLLVALLNLFDVVWANFNSTVDDGSVGAGGAVKAITSDGARVEFDVSSGAGSFGAADASSGIPSGIAAMLNIYKREKA